MKSTYFFQSYFFYLSHFLLTCNSISILYTCDLFDFANQIERINAKINHFNRRKVMSSWQLYSVSRGTNGTDAEYKSLTLNTSSRCFSLINQFSPFVTFCSIVVRKRYIAFMYVCTQNIFQTDLLRSPTVAQFTGDKMFFYAIERALI